jgi:diguanylate cyclase (GGDEF)-like protein
LFAIFGANVILLAAASFSCAGIGQFVGRKDNYAYLIALNVVTTAFQFYFLYINDNFIGRTFCLSVGTTIAFGLTAHYLLKCSDRSFLASARFTLVVICTFILLSVSRIVVLVFVNTPKDIFEPNLTNAIAFLGAFASGSLWSGGFMMMVAQRLYQEIYLLASVDQLTQSLNRRSMLKDLNLEANRFERTKAPFSLILLDVDFFKRINDTYGHDGGDLVLTHLAKVMQQNLRAYDRLSRWGGEEFLVLLPDTRLQEAVDIADRLRTAVETNPANGTIRSTISLGVAEIAVHADSVTSLITAADRALYQAKQTGRNCVAIASDI